MNKQVAIPTVPFQACLRFVKNSFFVHVALKMSNGTLLGFLNRKNTFFLQCYNSINQKRRRYKQVSFFLSGNFYLEVETRNNNIEIEKPLSSTKPWARPAIDALQTLLLILMLAHPGITLFILQVKNMRARESKS